MSSARDCRPGPSRTRRRASAGWPEPEIDSRQQRSGRARSSPAVSSWKEVERRRRTGDRASARRPSLNSRIAWYRSMSDGQTRLPSCANWARASANRPSAAPLAPSCPRPSPRSPAPWRPHTASRGEGTGRARLRPRRALLWPGSARDRFRRIEQRQRLVIAVARSASQMRRPPAAARARGCIRRAGNAARRCCSRPGRSPAPCARSTHSWRAAWYAASARWNSFSAVSVTALLWSAEIMPSVSPSGTSLACACS